MFKAVVVEDEELLRLGLINYFDWKSYGFELAGEAGNGEKGLEVIRKVEPDMVITDIKMPEMDGLELAEKLLELYPDIKMIFLTAYSDFEYVRLALRMGVSDYLLKPFQDGELEGAVQRLLHLNPFEKTALEKEEEELLGIKDKEMISNRYVKSAIEYIEEHYKDADFAVSGLAEHIGVSEGHISRLFKAETDTSINNYLTKYRIKKAMDYLKDVKVKVYEVAEQVGYQDIAYFSNTFKKLVGKSPSDYQSYGLK